VFIFINKHQNFYNSIAPLSRHCQFIYLQSSVCWWRAQLWYERHSSRIITPFKSFYFCILHLQLIIIPTLQMLRKVKSHTLFPCHSISKINITFLLNSLLEKLPRIFCHCFFSLSYRRCNKLILRSNHPSPRINWHCMIFQYQVNSVILELNNTSSNSILETSFLEWPKSCCHNVTINNKSDIFS
jgi:hypothetical protein